MRWLLLSAVAFVGQAFNAVFATDGGEYASIIAADQPVAHWSFGSDGLTDAPGNIDFELHGKASHAPGPSPPEFPLFASDNRALQIDGRNGYVRTPDSGERSVFDFDVGDSLTVEAWVSPGEIRDGGYVYVAGKGRTYRVAKEENQNWALRLKGANGAAALTFLFRSRGSEGDYHRWTSKEVLGVGDGWHHVAVCYTFGRSESLTAYIDGQAVSGKWDIGGATDRAPVVDDDDVWIGSAMGGQASSTFSGGIDEVAIYRRVLSPDQIRRRYRFQPTEPPPVEVPAGKVLVQVFEGVSDKKSWNFRSLNLSEQFTSEIFALPELPKRYSQRGVQVDRQTPFLVRAFADVLLPEGPHRLLFRSRDASRLFVDGQLLGETAFYDITPEANGPIWDLDRSHGPHIRPLQRGDRQAVVELVGDGKMHRIHFETLVGLRGRRPEMGDALVSLAPPEGDFNILSFGQPFQLTEEGWRSFTQWNRVRMLHLNKQRRDEAGKSETEYWQQRHALARDYLRQQGVETLSLAGAVAQLDRLVQQHLQRSDAEPATEIGDLRFLRRLSLDTVGTIPTHEQVAHYLADPPESRRQHAVDRLLSSSGWADHWMGYWQDVLAENPNIINPSLNNTGPFRWWLYESFWENKPFDRFVTELVRMEGSIDYGGPAGFELATENDVPMAAKAHVLGQAFLGVQMQCARCHDAPSHDIAQRDLFALAAMLGRQPQQVPKTSSINVPPEELERLAVQVTLKPGEEVPPEWTFTEFGGSELGSELLRDQDDSRERLAALITRPQNERFAQVIANRMWQRYLGRGIVEPVSDWELATPTHPDLLRFLGHQLVASGYDLKHIARLILNSEVYARATVTEPIAAAALAGPAERKLSAEQLLDSLFVVAGKPFDAGPMAVDIDGARPSRVSLNLGEPRRAWMFASTSNERDRPALALPFAQPFVTFLEQFGWRGTRQNPVDDRPDDLTPLQPAEFLNGVLVRRIARLSEDHAFTDIALREELTVDELVEALFLRIYTRRPTKSEAEVVRSVLEEGFQKRRLPDAPRAERPPDRRGTISWSNHLEQEASVIKMELQEVVRRGDPPTNRLVADWRERVEDVLWSMLNTPEFRFTP